MRKYPRTARKGTVRGLLADDHPVFRDGLRFVLSQADDLDLVAEVEDGIQAVRRALHPEEGEEPVDLVVMDVRCHSWTA